MNISQLSIHHLSKSYSGKKVIHDFSQQFYPGCYAIVGPNGTGKSTLLSLLAGAIKPDAGTVIMNGCDLFENPVQFKAMLGYAPDQAMIYPFLTGREFLNLVICLKPNTSKEAVATLLKEFKIETFLNIQIKDMSFGTQKKFFIVAALLNHPALIVMDEPTNAIDAEAKASLARHLKQSKNKVIILFSTHDAEFISETQATQIYLIEKMGGILQTEQKNFL